MLRMTPESSRAVRPLSEISAPPPVSGGTMAALGLREEHPAQISMPAKHDVVSRRVKQTGGLRYSRLEVCVTCEWTFVALFATAP